jgi:hypothetical protein
MAAIGDPGLTVALAGGVGAFLGATVGQGIQWVRELQTEGRLDRRRAEDRVDAAQQARRLRRHDDYLGILTFVQKLHDKLNRLEFVASTPVPENEKVREFVTERLRDVRKVALKGLPKATARAEMVGSSELRRLFVELNSVMAVYAGEQVLTNKVQFINEEKFDEVRRRKLAGEDVDLREAMEEQQVEWSEAMGNVHTIAVRALERVAAVREALREELDLI